VSARDGHYHCLTDNEGKEHKKILAFHEMMKCCRNNFTTHHENEIPVRQMPVAQKPVDQMPVDQMPVDLMLVDKMPEAQ
jgi:hypothetical protein